MRKLTHVLEPMAQFKQETTGESQVLVNRNNLLVKLKQMPPGALEEWYFAHSHLQLFRVLDGEALFEMDGERVALLKGESLLIQPGVNHRVLNTGKETLKFLLCAQTCGTNHITNPVNN
jgi:mannose-6-phosphate isomerase-like protein (cupin superfamily)